METVGHHLFRKHLNVKDQWDIAHRVQIELISLVVLETCQTTEEGRMQGQ